MEIEINTIFAKNNRINVRDASNLVQSGQAVSMVLPLSFRIPGRTPDEWWLFPIEPLISISGKNVIVRRNAAKQRMRGSVKERWSEDDLSINIQGSFRHSDLRTYPEEELKTLYRAARQREAIEVRNELLQMLGVNWIVIEDFSFPFSKGENVQNFTIDAYSDDITDLFIEIDGI